MGVVELGGGGPLKSGLAVGEMRRDEDGSWHANEEMGGDSGAGFVDASPRSLRASLVGDDGREANFHSLIHFGRFVHSHKRARAMASLMAAVGHAPAGKPVAQGGEKPLRRPSGALALAIQAAFKSERGMYNETTEGRPGERQPEWFIIHPHSPFRQFWDLLQIMLLLYAAVVIPFRTGFQLPAMGGMFVFESLMDVIFLMDLGLNFITGFEDHMKNIILHPGEIRRKYLRTYFVTDLVTSIPIDTILRASAGHFACSVADTCSRQVWNERNGAEFTRIFRVLKVFRLFKLLKLPQAQRILDRYMDELILYLPFISVAKLAFSVLYVAHIVACGFFYFSLDRFRSDIEMDEIDSGFTVTWFMQEFGTTTPERRYQYKEDGVLSAVTIRQYIASMHWAFQTMTTVGYGDIPVTSNSERIWAMFGMVVGCIVFSTFVSYISSAIDRIKRVDKVINERLDSVVDFIRANALPKEHQKMLIRHYRLQTMTPQNEAEFLMDLPYSLRSNIVQYLYSGRLQKVHFFDHCTNVMLTELATRIKPAYCVRGDQVYDAEEFATHIYIVTDGCIALTAPHSSLQPSFLQTDGLADIQDRDVSLVPVGQAVEAAPKDGSDLEEGEDEITFMLVGENSHFGEGAALLVGRRAECARARLNTSISMIAVDEFRDVMMHAEEAYPLIRDEFVQRYKWIFRNFLRDSSGGQYTWNNKRNGYVRNGEVLTVSHLNPSRSQVIPLTDLQDLKVRTIADVVVPPEQGAKRTTVEPLLNPIVERLAALEAENAALREAVSHVGKGNAEVLAEVREGFALMGEGFAMALAGRPLRDIQAGERIAAASADSAPRPNSDLS